MTKNSIFHYDFIILESTESRFPIPIVSISNHRGGGGGGGRTGLVVRASDSGSGDPSSILGQVGVLFP